MTSCVGCSSSRRNYAYSSNNGGQRQVDGLSITNNRTGESFKLLRAKDGNREFRAFQYQTGRNGETDLLQKLKKGFNKQKDQLKNFFDKLFGKDDKEANKNEDNDKNDDKKSKNNPFTNMLKMLGLLSLLSAIGGGNNLSELLGNNSDDLFGDNKNNIFQI